MIKIDGYLVRAKKKKEAFNYYNTQSHQSAPDRRYLYLSHIFSGDAWQERKLNPKSGYRRKRVACRGTFLKRRAYLM